MVSEETWKSVPGYEGIYEASTLGRIRSLDRISPRGQRVAGRVLKERPLPNGRPRVSLASHGTAKDAYTYRVVLETFVGPCPDGMEALHWDDDINNNRLENLRWGTRTDNMRDISRNGSGNAGVTHCPSGHPYSVENTYVYPSDRPHRGCRECGRRHSESKRRKAQALRKAA